MRPQHILKVLLNSLVLLALMVVASGVTPVYAASFVVNDNGDAVDAALDGICATAGGVCTLRAAIQEANNTVAADTITFAGNYTITLVGSQLPIVTTPITITGKGATNTIIQAHANSNTATFRVFQVNAGGNLTLEGLTVQNGRCNGSCDGAGAALYSAGGIYNNAGTLTITNSTISGNTASSTGFAGAGGGGVYNTGTLTITDSIISKNTATDLLGGGNGGDGGGVFNTGTLKITNSTISENTVPGGGVGGGVLNLGAGASLTITNSTFSGNTTTDRGGGIFNSGASLTITNSTFSGNTATASGGGVYNYDSGAGAPLTITNSTFSGNSASINGGGIYNTGALTVTDSTFSGNEAQSNADSNGGGGIFNSGSATVTGSTFTLNHGNYGGGIFNFTAGSTLTVTNTTFSGNTSTDGGGIFNDTGCTLNLRNSTFSGNTAGWEGGGIFSFGTLNYTNTIIANSIFHNLPTAGAECFCTLPPGTIGTNLNNLVEDGSGAASLSGDPALDPAGLADNGGPTRTIALLVGSPAIDAGDNATCNAPPVSNKDQRGVIRPQGTSCDIGAYEWSSDTAVPTVIFGAGSVPSSDGATLAVGPSQLQVRFSENVLSDGNPHAANSGWNYLLVSPGPNLDFDTTITSGGICESDHMVEGDDVRIEISGITYNAATFTATLTIGAADAPLANGQYRLYVCGAASIWDLVGFSLNNGANSAINFRVGGTITDGDSVSRGGQGNNVRTLPRTGFAPNVVTLLPSQPAELAYTELGSLWLEIPSLNVKAAIVGVPQSENAWDVKWLDQDAGWLNGTAFPSWEGNSVITAHVTDSNGKPGPFANIKDLKYGDQIIVHLFDGQYVFEIRNKRLVRPETTDFAFEHLEKNSYLTLITCQNYDAATDSYSMRRIIRAVLVDVK